MTKELENSELPEDVALKGMQLAESAPTRPQALIIALQNAGGLKPMKMSLSKQEMIAMIDRVNSKGAFTAVKICSALPVMQLVKWVA